MRNNATIYLGANIPIYLHSSIELCTKGRFHFA